LPRAISLQAPRLTCSWNYFFKMANILLAGTHSQLESCTSQMTQQLMARQALAKMTALLKTVEKQRIKLAEENSRLKKLNWPGVPNSLHAQGGTCLNMTNEQILSINATASNPELELHAMKCINEAHRLFANAVHGDLVEPSGNSPILDGAPREGDVPMPIGLLGTKQPLRVEQHKFASSMQVPGITCRCTQPTSRPREISQLSNSSSVVLQPSRWQPSATPGLPQSSSWPPVSL